MANCKRENLKYFRKENKMTQQEMAKRLNISLIQYQFIELGKRNPSFKVMSNFKNEFPTANLNDFF